MARGDNSDKKKIGVSYFLTRNPYMKFQNPSFKFLLNGRTNKRTNGLTSRKQYAPHFFKVGGIKSALRGTYTPGWCVIDFDP